MASDASKPFQLLKSSAGAVPGFTLHLQQDGQFGVAINPRSDRPLTPADLNRAHRALDAAWREYIIRNRISALEAQQARSDAASKVTVNTTETANV